MSSDPFVTSQEVAEYFKVNPQTVRRWIKRKDIPGNSYIKTGNEYRFDLERVKEALFSLNETDDIQVSDVFDIDEDM